LLETNAVAQQVIDNLKLSESTQTFLTQYQGVALSDEVLQVTVSAPSAASALLRANAVAAAFISIRQNLFHEQNAEIVNTLTAQMNTFNALATQLGNQIKNAPKGTDTSGLVTQQTSDLTQASNLFQTIFNDNLENLGIKTGSKVLDLASLVHESKLKKLISDAGSGLVAGLALGCGIVAFEAVLIERLRRREDIAAVLGAPVMLALPDLRRPRVACMWRLRRWLVHPSRSLRLVVGVLESQLDTIDESRSGFAIVDVDSVELASLSMAALARSLAAEGTQVTLLDLSKDRYLSKLLGLRHPGKKIVFDRLRCPTSLVWADEGDMVLDNDASVGQHRRSGAHAGEVAGIVLALVTLDPAIGSRHLTGQVSDAVAVVTVGQSKEAKARSVAEMLEAADILLRSVVVIGADPDDQSLGLVYVPGGESVTLSVAPATTDLAKREKLADS
jgi:capsular polysaccharide biosynthesis protein